MKTRDTNRRRVHRWLAVLGVALGAASAQCGERGIHGRVLAMDEQGGFTGMVPGATIEFCNQALAPVATVTADENGYYKADLSPGTYFYKVRAPGFRDENVGRGVQLQLMDGLAVYNLSLTKGPQETSQKPPEPAPADIGTIEGRVREKTADGKLVDIPGATVALRQSEGPPKLTSVITGPGPDGEGTGYYTTLLRVGSWAASASAPGFETMVHPRPLNIEKGKVLARDFVLKRSEPEPAPQDQGVRGTVRFRGPEPKPGASQVKISVRSLDEPSPAAPKTAAPNNKGNYSCDLKAGDYLLVAEAEGFLPAHSGPKAVFLGKYTVVDFTLVPLVPPEPSPAPAQLVFNARVLGATTDDVSPQTPIEGATVRLIPKAKPEAAQQAQTDAAGNAEMAVANPGTFLARGEKPGYRPAEAEVTIDPHRFAGVVMVLQPETAMAAPPGEAALRITVYEQGTGPAATRRPLPGANVLARADGAPLSTAVRGVTDAQGIVRLKIAGPGDYQAMARLADYAPGGTSVVVKAVGETPGEIVLRREAMAAEPSPTETPAMTGKFHIRIAVLDNRRHPVQNARVEIRLGEEPIASGQSDAQGRFTAGPLSPQRYYAVASKTGHQPAETDATITDHDISESLVLAPLVAATEPTVAPPMTPTPPPPAKSRPIQPTRPSTPVTPPEQTGARLLVQVFEYINREPTPVGGAQIVVLRKNRPFAEGRSGRDGAFTFELPRENYEVVVNKPAYVENRAGASLSQGNARAPIPLSRLETRPPPAQPAKPNLATLHVQVAGRDPQDGLRMLPGAQVTVFRGRAPAGTAATDRVGRVSFNLPPGEYMVGAAGNGYQSKRDPVALGQQGFLHRMVLDAEAPKTRPGIVQTQPIPAQPSPAQPGPMKLIPMQPLPAQTAQATLTVRVARAVKGGAMPLGNASVSVTPRQAGGDSGRAQTDGSGICRFRLRPGPYQIQIQAMNYHPAGAPVNVGSSDLHQDFVLQPSAKID